MTVIAAATTRLAVSRGIQGQGGSGSQAAEDSREDGPAAPAQGKPGVGDDCLDHGQKD